MKVMLAGPIKVWWSEWGSPRHTRYSAWRDCVAAALVRDGHLIYKPHEAWAGPWDESAQAVNDAAIEACDIVLNLTPPGVPSAGTDEEMAVCRRIGKHVIYTPPPDDREAFWLRAEDIASIVSVTGALV